MEFQQVSSRVRFSKSQKEEILSEHLDKGMPLSVVARKHGIHPITLSAWKRRMKEKDATSIDISSLLEEINQLKKENKILKQAHSEAVIHVRDLEEVNDFLKKKWISQQLKSLENSKKKQESQVKK